MPRLLVIYIWLDFPSLTLVFQRRSHSYSTDRYTGFIPGFFGRQGLLHLCRLGHRFGKVAPAF